MGAKDKKQANHPQSSENQSDQDFSDDGQEIDVREQVQKKIKALPTLKQKVQAIAINHHTELKRSLDEQLQRQLQQVQLKFRFRFNPFIEEMNKIINGEYEYNDTDFQQAGEALTGEQLSHKDHYAKKQKIPQYWLKVFLNSDVLGQQVFENDEPILKHLDKIQAQKTEDLKKMSVFFYFSQNEWFTNTKLAKHFDIQGQQINKSYGDQINWKQGKNITVKTVKKKGKKGAKKTKQIKQKSFFNLFKEVETSSDKQENQQDQNQEDEVEQLELQYQICQNIYESIIPKSLEYYLGINMDSGDCCGDQECTDQHCGSKQIQHKKSHPKTDSKVAEDNSDDQ